MSPSESTTFAIAGTAYPSGHEYDDCFGSAARNARVDVTHPVGTIDSPLTPEERSARNGLANRQLTIR